MLVVRYVDRMQHDTECSRLAPASLVDAFSQLPDPRREHLRQYDLMDILVLTLVAVICGSDSWLDIAEFGDARLDWFQEHGLLMNGAPSHDTLGRVFRRLDHQAFAHCFAAWVQGVAQRVTGVVAIDGKTLRGSAGLNGERAVHTLAAWASSSQLTLAMIEVDGKENEITAIPRLLDLLVLKGCIVTIDAMGCQKHIAKTILDKGADYLLAVKGNQGGTHKDIIAYCQDAEAHGFHGIAHDIHTSTNQGHGRKEERTVITLPIKGRWIANHGWPRAKQIVLVRSLRRINEEDRTEDRYYLTSASGDAASLAKAVRSHWGIENKLHCVLDVTFGEDDSRVRCDHAAKNFATIRRMVTNLLRQAPQPPPAQGKKNAPVNIRQRRRQALWRNSYLLEVLRSIGVSAAE